MEFNLDKCELKHFGKLNQGRTYSVNGRALGRVTEQRDLGVHVHSSMKVESQVDRVVNSACLVSSVRILNTGVRTSC